MVVEKTHLSHAACVLECGGCDAAFPHSIFASDIPMTVIGTIADNLLNCLPSPSGRGEGVRENRLNRNSALSLQSIVHYYPKSTPANPKSTVDLGLEPLIWVENASQKPLFGGRRHANCPTTARELNYQNRKHTETNQKINRALMFDLGICPSLTVVFGVVKVFVSRNSNGL